MAEDVDSVGGNPTDQKPNIREAAPSNLTALTDWSTAFKDDLLAHTKHWALFASGLKTSLKQQTGDLLLAFETGEILNASRNILQYVYNFCGHFRNMKVTQQQSLTRAKGMGLPVDIVQMHESLIGKYQEKENAIRVVIDEMKQRAEALQAASSSS
jgi:hypothetical protein